MSGILESRRLPLWAAAVSALLTLPSLPAGTVADDLFHRLRFVGSPQLPEIPADPSALFTFADGDPEHTRRAVDRGLWPWWTEESIHAAFWRPLTILTHRIDYWLWPDHPVLMHAQSIAWLAALVAAVAVLYRGLLGPTAVAGLAALLYAVDDAHGMPVGFLANRNAIVAGFFGVLAIFAHHRWRSGGSRVAAAAAGVCFAAALLSAEFGLGAFAYLVAYALCLDRGSWPRRWATLAPYVVMVIAWRIAWEMTGHGIRAIGLYVDPLADPLRYMGQAVQRAPILLMGQFGVPPSDSYLFAVQFGVVPILAAAALLFVGWVGRQVWHLVRVDRLARFWATGIALSLPPVCTTFASDRLLFFTAIGAFGLLAQWLMAPSTPEWDQGTRTSPSRARTSNKFFRWFLIGVHGMYAPLGLALRSAMPVGPKSLMETMLVKTPMDASVLQQSVILVTAPLPFATTYLPITRALAGLPVPAHVRLLAPHQPPITVQRTDPFTLVIRPEGGFLKNPWDQLPRDLSFPMPLHHEVVLTGMTASVTELTRDGRPAEVRFRFAVPLEDPSLRWLAWNWDWMDSEYVPFSVPQVGETITLH